METRPNTGSHDSGSFTTHRNIKPPHGCILRSAAGPTSSTPGFRDHDDCPFDETRDDSVPVNPEPCGPNKSFEYQTMLELASTTVIESFKAIKNCGANADECQTSESCDNQAMSGHQTGTTSTQYETDTVEDILYYSATKKASAGQCADGKDADWNLATGVECVPELALFAQEMADTSIKHFLGEHKLCLHCKEKVFSKLAIVRVHPYEDVKLQIAFLHPNCRNERDKVERCNLAVLSEINFLRSSIKPQKKQKKNSIETSDTVRTFYA